MAYGLQGGILALALGLAGGAVRRSASGAALGGLTGLVIGAAVGAGASLGIFPIFFRNLDPISGDILLPLITHAVFWATLGAAAGLAYGVGHGGGLRFVLRAVSGGILGAALAVLVYEFLGALAFPQAKTDQPFASEPAARLLAQALTGLAITLGISLGARPKASRNPSPNRPEAVSGVPV